jgi:chromosome segregation protein
MELFKANEIKSNQEQQALLQAKRLSGITLALNKLKEETESAQKEYENTLIRNSDNLRNIEITHETKIKEMTEEVLSLEQRKALALLPLEEKERELKVEAESLKKKEKDIENIKEDLKETRNLLEEKLTETEEKFEDLNRMKKLQEVSQTGLNTQREQVSLQAKSIDKLTEEALLKIKTREAELNKKETELNLIKKALDSKEESFIKREQELENKDIALIDKYNNLIIATDEARKKFNINI